MLGTKDMARRKDDAGVVARRVLLASSDSTVDEDGWAAQLRRVSQHPECGLRAYLAR